MTTRYWFQVNPNVAKAEGAAGAGAILLKERFNRDTQRGIIKVSHKYVDKVKASLCFIEKINNQQVIAHSIGTSGILKKAYNKYIA